jgi:hypothetical protein
MKKSFPYPLPIHALAQFLPPADWHALAQPRSHGGETLAGNGYVALRVARGAWLDSDIPNASADFLARWGKLPWASMPPAAGDWRPLSDAEALIYRRARIEPWRNAAVAPSPVWSVNEIPVRLSWLQLVGRLPRVEVFAGAIDSTSPLWFRFSGGEGLIAADPRLGRPSFAVFPPLRHQDDGERIERRQATGGLAWGKSTSMAAWPPVDTTDA